MDNEPKMVVVDPDEMLTTILEYANVQCGHFKQLHKMDIACVAETIAAHPHAADCFYKLVSLLESRITRRN